VLNVVVNIALYVTTMNYCINSTHFAPGDHVANNRLLGKMARFSMPRV
jgi:hypothetical protein